MDAIIDIKALSKMPITKEFAELLFRDADLRNITIDVGVDFINYISRDWGVSGQKIRISAYGDIKIMDISGSSTTPHTLTVRNAFQIVRYIDNYLNRN